MAPHALSRSGGGRTTRSRGQVVVIFGLSVFLFVSLCAVVVDVAWYWVSTLKVQRAADAAALAGAVYLPGDTGTAYAKARNVSSLNGYTDGGGATVTPQQDASNGLQLDVAVSTSVPTFFMRLVGITTIPVTRTAKAQYVLPVPMGSPLSYYGVGDFWVNKTTTSTHTDTFTGTSVSPFSSVTGGQWSSPDNAWTTGASYATENTTGQSQQWSTFKIPSADVGATIDGIAVSFRAKVGSGGANCQVKAELSWDGTHWGSTPQSTPIPPGLSTTVKPYALGSASAPDLWDASHTWTKAELTSNNFQVRLTYIKGTGCGTLSLNSLAVTVSSHTTTTTTTTALTQTPVVDPGGTTLASQGGWGAIITKGGNEQNGDAYAPANNGGNEFGGSNAIYDQRGYFYIVKLDGPGQIRVFDPGFCAMGSNGSAGSMGAGDHWIGTSGQPVSTYYSVWNTNGLPGLQTAWTRTYSSGSLFENKKGYDPNNVTPDNQDPYNGHPRSYYIPANATAGCDAYHNAWWTIPTGGLPAGTYAVEVATSNPNDANVNASTNAENMWSIEVVGGTNPQVYGNGKMAVYNNLQAGAAYQLFYLAKIDQQTGAGKTALIDIFDAGDVNGNATLKVLSPDGNTQSLATFSYTSDSNCNATVNYNHWSPSDSCSGSGVAQITTAVGGRSSFNNTWIHMAIVLPNTYGQGGLWQGGWWQIRYETPGGGNDTTTWQVSVRGNPVHLVVP